MEWPCWFPQPRTRTRGVKYILKNIHSGNTLNHSIQRLPVRFMIWTACGNTDWCKVNCVRGFATKSFLGARGILMKLDIKRKSHQLRKWRRKMRLRAWGHFIITCNCSGLPWAGRSLYCWVERKIKNKATCKWCTYLRGGLQAIKLVIPAAQRRRTLEIFVAKTIFIIFAAARSRRDLLSFVSCLLSVVLHSSGARHGERSLTGFNY